MKKELVLITGSVMNFDLQSVETYTKLISMLDSERFDVSSPLDTMKFQGSDSDRYKRAIQTLNNTKFMIAEMSNVSTGQGMEIQQAANFDIPILVIAKTGSKISGLVKGCPVVRNIIFYDDSDSVKEAIDKFVMD